MNIRRVAFITLSVLLVIGISICVVFFLFGNKPNNVKGSTPKSFPVPVKTEGRTGASVGSGRGGNTSSGSGGSGHSGYTSSGGSSGSGSNGYSSPSNGNSKPHVDSSGGVSNEMKDKDIASGENLDDEYQKWILTDQSMEAYDPNNILSWPESLDRQAGLENLGNSCYINAALQSLVSVPSIVNALRENEAPNLLAYSLCRNVLVELSNGSNAKINPQFFVETLQELPDALRAGEQQDSHEFVKWLFASFEGEGFPFLRFFRFTLETTMTCGACKREMKKLEQAVELTVPLVEQKEVYAEGDIGKDAPRTSVRQCIERLARPEAVGQYRCRKCSAQGKTTSTLKITSPPQILMIVLGRFVNDLVQGAKKVRIGVDIEEKIEVAGAKYNLKSYIDHRGDGLGAGHYVAFASRNDQWYEFNDRFVRRIDKNEALSSADVYILFYERIV